MKADPWVLNILDRGLIIPFTGDPPNYYEKNNKSALVHMVELRKIIKDWELKDICQKVSFKPKCVNPADKVDKKLRISAASAPGTPALTNKTKNVGNNTVI